MFGLRTYMNLEEAIKISEHPTRHKPHRMERALRILIRWAKGPCSDTEYRHRLCVAARVFIPYKSWLEQVEAEKKRFEDIIAHMNKEKKRRRG